MKKRNLILFFSVIILIATLIYRPILVELFTKVIHREESSHGLFIPLLSLYFIWLKRSRLKEIEMRFSPEGLILIAIGFLLFFYKKGGEGFYTQSVSFIIVISGLLYFFMGKKFFKEVSFPVLFLICMIPIPKDIYVTLAEYTRDITLGTATWILAQTNVPFLRENILLHLPNVSLSVNLGCSGIRYLISYFVFGIAYAYIFRTQLIDRIFLVGLTIPISILASSMRLMVIILSAYYIGSFMAEHTPHVLISWSVFFIVLMSAIVLDRFIDNLKILKKEEKVNVGSVH